MEAYKRKYHPLIILLYSADMIHPEQKRMIPKSTRSNWNQFSHQQYYGHDWAKDYINRFDEIKAVFESKFIYRTMRMACAFRSGYKDIISQFEKKTSILRSKAISIVKSINHIAKNGGISIKNACKSFGVSSGWYYRYQTDVICSLSKINRCFKKYPNQLTAKEVQTIEDIVNYPVNKGKTLVSLYYRAMNEGEIACSYPTFTKYARLVGYEPVEKKKRPPNKGFKASRPFEWLHVDITKVPTLEDGLQKVAFVRDNFSGAILHWKSTNLKAGGEFIKLLFKETFFKYHLLDQPSAINIVSDGGPENKGAFTDWLDQIKAPPLVKKVTAMTSDFPWSNSHSERLHSIFKTEYLHGSVSLNRKLHLKDTEDFVHYHNHLRYPIKFFGLTALQVLHGAILDKDLFKRQKALAKENRIRINQEFNQCPANFC